MKEIDGLYARANELGEKGDYVGAAKLYLELADLVPTDSPFRLLAAEAFASAGDHSSAISICRHVISEDQNNAFALRALGKYLIATKNLDNAETFLKQSIDIGPTASAHLYLAQVFRRKYKFEAAKKQAEEALRLAPPSLHCECHYALGHILFVQKRLPQAYRCFAKALELEPEYIAAQIALNTVHAEMSSQRKGSGLKDAESKESKGSGLIEGDLEEQGEEQRRHSDFSD